MGFVRIAVLAAVLGLAAHLPAHAASRIKDLASVEGVRQNIAQVLSGHGRLTGSAEIACFRRRNAGGCRHGFRDRFGGRWRVKSSKTAGPSSPSRW